MASGFWPVGAVPGFFFFHFGDVAEVVAIIHKEV
jgi:hypothetical protein